VSVRHAAFVRCLLPGLIVLAFIAAGVWASIANGSVNDEYAAHITGGYLYWVTGRFAGGVHNPPLGQLWVALPLWLSGKPLMPFTDVAPVLPRLANVLLAAGLLLWVYRVCLRRMGLTAAMVAMTTTAFCPEFLAHASLATLDLPATATFFGAIGAFASLLLAPAVGRVLLFAALLAAALLTKVTGLLLFPAMALMLASLAVTCKGRRYARWLIRSARRHRGFMLAGLVAGVLLAWLLIGLAYRFEGCGQPKTLSGTGPGAAIAMLARPFPTDFVEATRGKLAYAGAGNAAYLLGRHSTTGWWWYYPVALAIKTPMPLLLLWLLAAGWAIRRASARGLLFVLPALTVIALAMAGSRTQIGIRHLLPIVPLLGVCCGQMVHGSKKTLRRVAILLAVMTAGSFLFSLPYPLSAESLLAGGKGYRLLADSNFDWGQANGAILKQLEEDPALLPPRPYTPSAGRFLLRANELNGFARTDKDEFHWLRNYDPVGRVAGAGLLYVLTLADLETTRSNVPFEGLDALEEAMRLGSAGSWSRANPLFETALRTCPSSGTVLRGKARLLEEQGAFQEAYRELRRAVRIAPDDGFVRNDFERTGLLLEAARLEKQEPSRAEFQKANALILAGDYPASRVHLEKARALGAPLGAVDRADYLACCLAGEWANAARLLERTPDADRGMTAPPGNLVRAMAAQNADVRSMRELAMWCFVQRSWVQAAALCLAILDADPANAEAANYLGELVVRYKDGSAPMSNRDRGSLEKLKYP
jgi:tetratricopeptide (TPR) repeat protein